MIQKIKAFFSGSPKKQTISDFLATASNKEKEEFLGRIAQQVNEDQRKIIEDANHIGA
jgi:hypothetical protein